MTELARQTTTDAIAKVQARRDYIDLLGRRHNSKASDAEALAKVMDALGLSHADVLGDVAALDAIQAEKAKIPSDGARAEIVAEIDAAAEHLKAARKAFEDAEDRLKAAGFANMRAMTVESEADKTVREIRRQNPRAFGLWPVD